MIGTLGDWKIGRLVRSDKFHLYTFGGDTGYKILQILYEHGVDDQIDISSTVSAQFRL